MTEEKRPLLTEAPSTSNPETVELFSERQKVPSPKHSKTTDEEYDPAAERNLEHPTSNFDTLIHLLKGNIGTGILAMPDAFKNAGLVFGVFGTIFMGVICTHCMHMLVVCANELCMRSQRPSLSFAEVVEEAFLSGPVSLRPYAKKTRTAVNIFLCITQLGFCCVYFLFVATNMQAAFEYFGIHISVQVYLAITYIPMIALIMVKNLKNLSPVSLIAFVLTAWALVVTFYYIFQDLPRVNTVRSFSTWHQLPLYFGTAIYAFEGIGMVLPLENNMRTPDAFLGWNGVLNTGMAIVGILYTAVGFFGYLKYGDDVRGSITLNLPMTLMAQGVRVCMGTAIFLSYGLQFYVPMNIIWPYIKPKLNTEAAQNYGEIATRVILVTITLGAAAVIPNLSSVISLVGAVSSSALALIFPPLIEIVTLWPDRVGVRTYTLWKDIAIALFGIIGFVFGTYASLENIISD